MLNLLYIILILYVIIVSMSFDNTAIPANQLALLASELGLSQREFQVYIALVELGQSSVARIAKRAKLVRTTTYSLLDSLVERGLASIERRHGASSYLPASPEALVALAEEKVRAANATLTASKSIAQHLRSASGRDQLSEAKVRLYEGERAIRAMLYDLDGAWRSSVIQTRRPWMGFQDQTFLQHYGQWVVDYWKEYQFAKDRELDRVMLFSAQGPVARRVKEAVGTAAGSRRALRQLPKDFPFTATLWIMGEYVLVLKTRAEPHYAMLVRDALLAENLAVIFELFWEKTDGE